MIAADTPVYKTPKSLTVHVPGMKLQRILKEKLDLQNLFPWRKDNHQNDIQHNDTQNKTKNVMILDADVTLSVTIGMIQPMNSLVVTRNWWLIA
jgi:hypothetical protein